MGKKYSINSAGYIVAERDVYSLGGFIPKGSVGGKVANELQLSQDGECWLGGGDISTNENVRIRDNAFVKGLNVPANAQGDVFTFDGSTFVGGILSVSVDTTRGHKSDLLVRNSFIGTEMNVLCGASATAFTFEQGAFNNDAAAGTPFDDMKMDQPHICRTSAIIRVGRNTQVYVPSGLNCRVFWAYFNSSGVLVYSGESFVASTTLTKLEHPVYKLCMVHITQVNGNAMTPAQLETKGARIIGHVSGSIPISLKPASVSGNAVMENSAISIQTTNFGLSLNAIRWLAGELINADVYTVDRVDLKVFGTFRNVDRLEYHWYIADAQLARADRDTFVQAYDCPLFRLQSDTFGSSIWDAGSSLILRNCIVPKAMFTHNKVLGNTYENIDFSYAQEFLGMAVANGTTRSSHTPGHYDVFSLAPSNNHVATISRPGNAEASTKFDAGVVDVPLDGDIIEQGAYSIAFDKYYEDQKNNAADRVRTGKPLSTHNAHLPTMPTGFKVTSIVYLRSDLKIQTSQNDPTVVVSDNPFFVLNFGKTDNSAITPKELVALNLFIRSYDYSRVPVISGSGYVGAGVTVRGDVQVIGQPYVNRLLDVNEWESGSVSNVQEGWEQAKNPPGSPTDANRRRLKNVIRVERGSKITCQSGYWITVYWFDSDGKYISSPGWGQTQNIAPDNAAFAGMILKKSTPAADAGEFIEDSDIPLAAVRYVTEFKTANYITNELDRRDPRDILIGPDYWETGTIANTEGSDGKIYEAIKLPDAAALRPKALVNILNTTLTTYIAEGFNRGNHRFDANTRFYYGTSTPVTSALQTFVIRRTAGGSLTPSDITDIRFRANYIPTPRILAPYGSAGIAIQKTRVRLYDNAVLSVQIANGVSTILRGNSVMGTVPGTCVCAWGGDAKIRK